MSQLNEFKLKNETVKNIILSMEKWRDSIIQPDGSHQIGNQGRVLGLSAQKFDIEKF